MWYPIVRGKESLQSIYTDRRTDFLMQLLCASNVICPQIILNSSTKGGGGGWGAWELRLSQGCEVIASPFFSLLKVSNWKWKTSTGNIRKWGLGLVLTSRASEMTPGRTNWDGLIVKSWGPPVCCSFQKTNKQIIVLTLVKEQVPLLDEQQRNPQQLPRGVI